MATNANTVTIMVGSYLNMDQMVSSGVIPELVANGDIGLDALDYDMAYETYHNTGLVPKLIAPWAGSGTGTQEMAEYSGIKTGGIELTNTTSATIYIPAQGALFFDNTGLSYQTIELPNNAAWTNGTSATGSGFYAVASGQTIAVPIEATFLGDAGSDNPMSITRSSIAGLTVQQPDALSPGGDFSTPEANNQSGWLTNNFGNWTFVFADQGLHSAEGHVNVNAAFAWTSLDVSSWDGYVDNARSVGILNLAPLESNAAPNEDPAQPFATSAWYAGMRSAGLYGGGICIELPPYYWFHNPPSIQQNIIEEIRWCNSNGIRSSILVSCQTDFAGDPDPNYADDLKALLSQLAGENALPSELVIENDNPTNIGDFYDKDPGDTNSLNNVALTIDSEFHLTPSASVDGLEVKGTTEAQTTLIMTGVRPTEDLSGGVIAPYENTHVFSEDPAKTLTVVVTDTAGLLSLSDSVTGVSVTQGGSLTFTGTAAEATKFLNGISAVAPSGSVGIAKLSLSLTDYLKQQTIGETAVYVGNTHPLVTSIMAETQTTGAVRPGGSITFVVSTSHQVNVIGRPTLLLTNGAVATYSGQTNSGALSFKYTVSPNDDTLALRVRGLRLNGSVISDSNGLALDPDSVDQPEAAMISPPQVNTKNDSIYSVTTTGSSNGLQGAGDTITFFLHAANAVSSVSGATPFLQLSDGGTAVYSGLTADGLVAFTYKVPTGGAASNVTPILDSFAGAMVSDNLGEPVNVPSSVAVTGSPLSYDATGLFHSSTLTIGLSEDAYLGDAVANLTWNGYAIGQPIDVTAIHSAHQTQIVTITGNFSTGENLLGVNFSNDAWGGSILKDRNLHIDSVSLDGTPVASHNELFQNGTLYTPVTSGSINKLQMWVSEDAFQGNAMFSVSVDGVSLPGVFSTTASHAQGSWQEVDAWGNFGIGPHTVQLTFLNDSYQGTAATDRNLYVQNVALNGSVLAVNQSLLSTGATSTVNFPAPSSDVLTLDVSEDAWVGDAKFFITVDGKMVGGIETATAIHHLGQDDIVTIDGILAHGNHQIGLAFINDAWGGTLTTDRNLYLDAAQLNGVPLNVKASLYSNGMVSFNEGGSALSSVTVADSSSLMPYTILRSGTTASQVSPYVSQSNLGVAANLHVTVGSPMASLAVPST